MVVVVTSGIIVSVLFVFISRTEMSGGGVLKIG